MRLILPFLLLSLSASNALAQQFACIPFELAVADMTNKGFGIVGDVDLPNGNKIVLVKGPDGIVSGYTLDAEANCIIVPGIPTEIPAEPARAPAAAPSLKPAA
jgi:hypothetical protein